MAFAVHAAVGARPVGRGFRLNYKAGATCPGCDGGQWHVGRLTAQCARCGTALPIATGGVA